MKRTILVVLLALVLAFASFGCDNQSVVKDGQTTETTQQASDGNDAQEQPETGKGEEQEGNTDSGSTNRGTVVSGITVAGNINTK